VEEKGTKFDGQGDDGRLVKSRWSLLPWRQMEQVVKVFTLGAIKYSDNNWQCVKPRSRYVDALMRHFVLYYDGEKFDTDLFGRYKIKVSHLACLVCNALFLMWFEDNERHDDEIDSGSGR